MHTKKELDARMNEAGIRPLKRLGQNFLVNPQICKRIIDQLPAFQPKTVIEIGPGLGALTDEILQGPWKSVLVEFDAGLVDYWKSRSPQTKIIHSDALKLDWEAQGFERPSVLVSNLPYSIAASIVVELGQASKPPVDGMVLMFQKEVAERIEARAGDEDYGMLSVVAQANWVIHRVVDAGPQDFYPVPHVGSRVLKFQAASVSFDRTAFLNFVKTAFAQRRKKLSSNLSEVFEKAGIDAAFSEMGLKDDVRAQDLTMEQFLVLFRALSR